MTQKIWISYHKDEEIEQYGLKEDATHILFPTHKKAEKRNINHLNPVYSEMVTMWYVWKNNLKSKYVGFEHYRRHFEVSRYPRKGECQIYRVVDFLFESVYNQYGRCHSRSDMDLMLQAIDNRYGKDNPYTKNIRESHVLVSNCCFLMHWADFVKMCEFLFPLLDDFAALCGLPTDKLEKWQKKAVRDFGQNGRVEYQTRCLSFLAERLISAWILTNLAPYLHNRNVAIVHYNTPELTMATIRSLMKNSPGFRVTVFDNSDEKPFVAKMPNVDIIDNTKGQIIDFDKIIEKYADRDKNDVKLSNYGSAKHSMSVDYLTRVLPEGFILLDSDVLVKQFLGKLWDESFACAGAVEKKHDIPLLSPFVCYLNTRMLYDKGVTYFNGDKMWALTEKIPNRYYDTGAWLYEGVSTNNLPMQLFDIWQFVEHLGHGSWRRNGDRAREWLEKHKKLWE